MGPEREAEILAKMDLLIVMARPQGVRMDDRGARLDAIAHSPANRETAR